MTAAPAIIAASVGPRILVCDRFASAHPKPRSGRREFYFSLEKAFHQRWPFDAHFQACTSRTERRLSNASSATLTDISVGLLVADVDDPVAHESKTPARLEWRETQRTKLDALRAKHPGALSYETRGGMRIVFRLSKPFAISTQSDKFAWWSLYANYLDRLAAFGIEADPACKDWTRLYRLPFVTREDSK